MKKTLVVILCVSAALLSGCIWFESVDQPTSALPNEIITVDIEVMTIGGIYPTSFGVCLPDGWTVPGDSILCTGVYNETIYYDSLVSESHESASPAQEGYYWWGGLIVEVETDSGNVYAELEIQTDNQLGLFSIDYMLVHYYGIDRSDDHLIGIVDEYTPRSLQAVVIDSSVILDWESPLITEGLRGYIVYRDQQVISTSLLTNTNFTDEFPLDGIHYYAVSSIYMGHIEHLTPYEMPVVFGDLYISPLGDNSNSGSSFADALLTISFAMSVIKPDSLHPQTIYLAPGVYSPSNNGEQFPISFMDYMSLLGSGEDVTILDAESQSTVLSFSDVQNVLVRGLTVTNSDGFPSGINCSSSTPIIEDVTITNNSAYFGGGIHCSSSNPNLINVSITDNSAYFGGGIHLSYSNLSLENVVISGNFAESGGGIYCDGNVDDNLTFANVTITDNSAVESGGGIYIDYPNIEFDNYDRCNIYLNSAPVGNDLYSSSHQYVVVDTFTVLNPTEFQAYPIGNYSFYIQEGMVPQTEDDLFVSPDGNNANSGLTADDPLKTTHYAFNKTLANILNPQTIHLLNGKYSPSTNGDYFPICIPDYVSLSGESEIGTTLDAEGLCEVMRIWYNEGSSISNLTLTGGAATYGGGGIYCVSSSPSLENITITGNSAAEGNGGGGISLGTNSNANLVNVTITNNHAEYGGGMYCHASSPNLVNVTIAGNTVDWQNGGIYCLERSHPTLENCILWNDSWPEVYFHPSAGPDTITISYSDIKGGESGINTNNNGTVYWEEGNINEDPYFVYPDYNDHRLLWDSPCIDAGFGTDPDGTIADMGASYYDQSMAQRILITPHETPIEIPPEGGSFDFTIWLTNIDSSSPQIQAGTAVNLPNGSIYGPVIGPVSVALDSGVTVSRIETQDIPANAPPGLYIYNAFAKVGSDVSRDRFFVTKLETD
jgi:predicted outer membrane repeat protein